MILVMYLSTSRIFQTTRPITAIPCQGQMTKVRTMFRSKIMRLPPQGLKLLMTVMLWVIDAFRELVLIFFRCRSRTTRDQDQQRAKRYGNRRRFEIEAEANKFLPSELTTFNVHELCVIFHHHINLSSSRRKIWIRKEIQWGKGKPCFGGKMALQS